MIMIVGRRNCIYIDLDLVFTHIGIEFFVISLSFSLSRMQSIHISHSLTPTHPHSSHTFIKLIYPPPPAHTPSNGVLLNDFVCEIVLIFILNYISLYIGLRCANCKTQRLRLTIVWFSINSIRTHYFKCLNIVNPTPPRPHPPKHTKKTKKNYTYILNI